MSGPLKSNGVVLYLKLGLIFLFLFTLNAKTLQAAKPIPTRIRNSVVKIRVISQVPDYAEPWNPGSSNARFIAVEKEGDSRQYEARIKFIAHDCDLAILEVLDDSFLNDLTPLSFGNVPSLNSTVTVIGY